MHPALLHGCGLSQRGSLKKMLLLCVAPVVVGHRCDASDEKHFAVVADCRTFLCFPCFCTWYRRKHHDTKGNEYIEELLDVSINSKIPTQT